jgi:hypothetical protein
MVISASKNLTWKKFRGLALTPDYRFRVERDGHETD